jgi:hypothetical protein
MRLILIFRLLPLWGKDDMKRFERILILTVITLLTSVCALSWIQSAITRTAWESFGVHDPIMVYLDGKLIPKSLRDRAGSFTTASPSQIARSFFDALPIRALYSPTHAQVGLVSVNLTISSQTCTQLLTGTTTTKIFVYYGLLTFSTAGTGQTLTFQPGLTNGSGSTCGTGAQVNFGTSAIGTIVVVNTGTSATATTQVTIGQGAPAMVIPTSSALDVTTATATAVNGWLTVAQQ